MFDVQKTGGKDMFLINAADPNVYRELKRCRKISNQSGIPTRYFPAVKTCSQENSIGEKSNEKNDIRTIHQPWLRL